MSDERKIEKQKIKGAKVPRAFIWGLGRTHGKSGYLEKTEEIWSSVYIHRKLRDYQHYTARIYKMAAWKLAAEERLLTGRLAQKIQGNV